MSGSPIASVMTSTPAARFSAIFRSSWANRYGGMRSRRSLVSHRAPCGSRRRGSPRSTGTAQPVRVTCRSSPTSTSSAPPSRRTVIWRRPAGEVVGDGGAAGAGPGRERLADAALEDAGADHGRVLELAVPGHVGAVGEQRVALDRGADRRRGRASRARRRRSHTGGCRSRRAGSARRGRRRRARRGRRARPEG